MGTTYYRNPRGRSMTDEEIARAWITAHPTEAAELLHAGRSRPEPRPFAIHTKAVDETHVRVERADPDELA